MTEEEKKLKAVSVEGKKVKEIDFRDTTTCETTLQMLQKVAADGHETAISRAFEMKPCPIGAESACCKHCFMGPCRLNARDPYSRVGVCGATIDTIAARNFARMVASGGAAHTDHGMGMLDVFREVINGNIKGFQIKDEKKLRSVASSIGIEVEGREVLDVAKDLYKELERTYTQVEGEIPFAKRVPAKTLETWRKHGVVPRGAMREIMEIMHRTHMGVDQDYENIVKQCSRTALADGWAVWQETISNQSQIVSAMVPSLQAVYPDHNVVAITPALVSYAQNAFGLLSLWASNGVQSVTEFTSLVPQVATETAFWTTGAASGQNFSLVAGGFLWIQFNTNQVLDLGVNSGSSLDLAAGANVFSYTGFPDAYDAFSLLRQLGANNVLSVRMLDSVSGRWRVALVQNGNPVGDNFPIPNTAVLMVNMANAVNQFYPQSP